MSRRSKLAAATGVGVSLGAHALILLLVVAPPTAPSPARERVQVQVVRPPPPPPLPAKPVEPPRVKPNVPRRPVPAPAPTPDAPPPRAPAPTPILAPALSATSFAASGSFSAPVGAGVVAPVAGTPSPDGVGSQGGVDEPARVRSKPTLLVPDAARAARIEGSWTILVDVDATGRPLRARPAGAIGWGLDDACVEAWMRSTWRAARSGGVPVASSDNPVRCTVKETR